MAFILYSKGTSPTGSALAQRLGIKGGTEPPEKRVDVLIRWGSTAKVPLVPRLVLNRANAIGLATDKMASWEILKKNSVPVPEIFTADVAESKKGLLGATVLGRKQFHSQGTDIILCLQAADVRRCLNRAESDYFVVYIPTKREYRIHVFKDRVIRENQKLLKDGEAWVPFIRNFENGYIFGQPKKPITPEQKQIAVRAVQCLGLDFGAVDLILGDDNKSYVLEVNTGPALVDNGLDIYTEEFKKVLHGINGLQAL